MNNPTRKVVLKMSVSVDGYMGTSDGGLDWVSPSVDSEVTNWLVDILLNAGTHIMGRVLYDTMAAYWPTAANPFSAPMNEIPKVVFSKTLKQAEWQVSEVAGGDIKEEISRLKRESDGYILAHGGSRFTQSLDKLGLIDEYRLLVHPVTLGSGLPLFAARRNLKLIDCKKFGTGAVALTYQPA
jgi:dihydrofolate reductase